MKKKSLFLINFVLWCSRKLFSTIFSRMQSLWSKINLLYRKETRWFTWFTYLHSLCIFVIAILFSRCNQINFFKYQNSHNIKFLSLGIVFFDLGFNQR